MASKLPIGVRAAIFRMGFGHHHRTQNIRDLLGCILRNHRSGARNAERLRSACSPEAIDRLLREHNQGAREHTWKLWTLLTLALWIDTFDVRT